MGTGARVPSEVVFERLQSVSHADLGRLVPRLFPDESPPCWQGDQCTITFRDGRLLRLTLGTETERRLGALRIVSTPMRFVFTSWLPVDVQACIRRIEQALQQGGG